MHLLVLLSLLAILQGTRAHGDHGSKEEETNMQYARRHMTQEHHIDSFDLRSFFQLHDLNRDGVWDREEIEALYGVHHVYARKTKPDEKAQQDKANTIVQTILRNVDENGDGKITPEELERKGLDSLPNFKELGAEGHHYDIESEFFLHHEEEFHSTPETQTDESYNHPEDLEHFAMHEQIEAEEAARERRFQGITDDPPPSSKGHDHDHPAPVGSSPPPPPAGKPHEPPIPGVESLAPEASHAVHPHDDQRAFGVPDKPLSEPPAFPTRETPPEKKSPEERFGKKTEGEAWGQGAGGYKRPKTDADRMRKNLPYKYKFRRNWGDF